MQVRSLGIVALISAGVVSAALLAAAGSPAPAPAAPTPAAEAATFKIDPVHSAIIYKIRHAGVGNFIGRFNKFSGDFTWDAAKPDAAKVNITIDASSIDTNNSGRDNHLKGNDFFNAKEFPDIKFTSTALAKAGDNWELTGDMTLLGKSHPVKAKFEFIGEKDAGPRMGYRAGFEATFTFKRSEFGMSYGVDNGSLGDDVQVTVALEGSKQ